MSFHIFSFLYLIALPPRVLRSTLDGWRVMPFLIKTFSITIGISAIL